MHEELPEGGPRCKRKSYLLTADLALVTCSLCIKWRKDPP